MPRQERHLSCLRSSSYNTTQAGTLASESSLSATMPTRDEERWSFRNHHTGDLTDVVPNQQRSSETNGTIPNHDSRPTTKQQPLKSLTRQTFEVPHDPSRAQKRHLSHDPVQYYKRPSSTNTPSLDALSLHLHLPARVYHSQPSSDLPPDSPRSVGHSLSGE